MLNRSWVVEESERKMNTKMIAATIAAVAMSAFADGIVSSEVVGYQSVDVPAGSSMRTATFKAISGDYKISDIGVQGATGAGNEFGQLINTDGTWGDMYYYLTEDEAFVPNGWYKDIDGGTPVTDEDVLTVGQAFIFTSDSDITFTYSGQVIKQPTYNVPAGSSIVGNPSPVEVKFSEITVEGAVGAGNEFGQMINTDGTWGDMYYYLTEDEAFVPNGWYKDIDGGTPVTDEDVLSPADSMIFTSDSDLTFTFPAVL